MDKMIRALKAVKTFLEKRQMDFKVVGSIALKVCGMPLQREPQDIDVEVIATPQQEEIFKALADQYGSDYYDKKEYNLPGCNHKPYIFMMAGVKVNVWCFSEYPDKRFVRSWA